MSHKSNTLHASLLLICVVHCPACDDDDAVVSFDGGTSQPGGGAGNPNAGSPGVDSGGPANGGSGAPGTMDSGTGGMGGTGGMDAGLDAGPSVPTGVCAVDDGQCIFRHETFGDEQLWTDTLMLHQVVQTLTPTAALGVGLKVDADAVPADVLATADLTAAETTVALLSLNAVVGVRASIEDGMITRIGITCALCHSTVDDSVMPGIGQRLDGWPNRDLDPGAIIAMTPGVGALAEALEVTTEAAVDVLQSWGPGRYDARFNQDGESFPVLIPPAYGLADVPLETYTGDGPVSYWNAYVAVTQMGAMGNFQSEPLGLDIVSDPDLVTPRLPALRDYQFSLLPPEADSTSFDADAAARGELIFAASCASCHAGDSFTDAPTLHDASEVGTDTNEARRSVSGMYRTTPLRGVSTHPPFFHDGSAATLEEVVAHYDALFGLALTPPEEQDLVEYLKSL